MTTSPNSPDSAWVLEAFIRTARASDTGWEAQLNMLRPIAFYDEKTQTWHARLGAIDLAGLEVLQTLFAVARTYGTDVQLAPVPVPAYWDGPVFTTGSDVAALLKGQADRGRPLGQLPLA
jgi:hypothetical protein